MNLCSDSFRDIDELANQAATSTHNDRPAPTLAQQRAGNYKKSPPVYLQGLEIILEQAAGSLRTGVSHDGRPWARVNHYPYGYIKSVDGKSVRNDADQDKPDVMVAHHPESDLVYVIDQVHPHNNKFDEHKIVIGALNEAEARKAYLGEYPKGWKGLGAITALTIDELKHWLLHGDTTKPIAQQRKAVHQVFKAERTRFDYTAIWHRLLAKADAKKTEDRPQIDPVLKWFVSLCQDCSRYSLDHSGPDDMGSLVHCPGCDGPATTTAGPFDDEEAGEAWIHQQLSHLAKAEAAEAKDRKPVQRPGIRGGHFYMSRTGRIIYGRRPVAQPTWRILKQGEERPHGAVIARHKVTGLTYVRIAPPTAGREPLARQAARVGGESPQRGPSAVRPSGTPESAEVPNLPEPAGQPGTEESKPFHAGDEPRHGNVGAAFSNETGALINFRYRVVPLADLKVNDPEVQPRDRTRISSAEQVTRIAQKFNPHRYMEGNTEIDRGLPIVGDDLKVESGNGRMLALRQMRQNEPERFEHLRSAQIEHAARFGLSEKDFEGIDDPVLVRERTTTPEELAAIYEVPVSEARQRFADDANARSTLAMSPSEQAATDAERITSSAIQSLEIGETQTIEQALGSPRNAEIVRTFIGDLPKLDRNALVTADGKKLTPTGVQRLKGAILAHVFPGPEAANLVTAATESSDSNVKNLESGIFGALGPLAKVKSAVEGNSLAPTMDISEDIPHVVRILSRLRQAGGTVDDFLRQESFLGPELSRVQKRLLSMFATAKSAKVIREFLIDLADSILQLPPPGQGSMFGAPAATKDDVVESVLRRREPVAPDEPVAKARAALRWVLDSTGHLVKAAEVKAPGSRGGKYYVTDAGKIEYGERPIKHVDAPWLAPEALARWRRVEKMNPVVIRPGHLATVRDINRLREEAKLVYRKLAETRNADDGRVVKFPVSAFRKFKDHTADRRLLEIVPSLPELMRGAVRLYSAPDRKPAEHRNIESWHHYGVRGKLNDRIVYVRLITWQQGGQEFLYHYDTQVVSQAETQRALRGGQTPVTNQEGSRKEPIAREILVQMARASKGRNPKRGILKAIGAWLTDTAGHLRFWKAAQLGLFEPRKPVQEPGSRGGHYWRDKKGVVRYGDKPEPIARTSSGQPVHTVLHPSLAAFEAEHEHWRAKDHQEAAERLSQNDTPHHRALAAAHSHLAAVKKFGQSKLDSEQIDKDLIGSWKEGWSEHRRAEAEAKPQEPKPTAPAANKEPERPRLSAPSPKAVAARPLAPKSGDDDYIYRDVGYVAGSRKELAQATIRMAARDGKQVHWQDVDWQSLEENPRAAASLVTKSNVFGDVDWKAFEASGMAPGAGYLIRAVYASVGTEPDASDLQRRQSAGGEDSGRIHSMKRAAKQTPLDALQTQLGAAKTIADKQALLKDLGGDEFVERLDAADTTAQREALLTELGDKLAGSGENHISAQARQDYVRGINTVRERLEACKDPDAVLKTLADIADERGGTMLTAEESDRSRQLYAKAQSLALEERAYRAQLEPLAQRMHDADSDASRVDWERSKRQGRKWKPDPELDAEASRLTEARDKAREAYMAAHRPEQEAKWRSQQSDLYHQREKIEVDARRRNLTENEMTRAWHTLGARFAGVLAYRQDDGSDAFAKNVAAVKAGKVADWSWANTEPKARGDATKQSTRFQLLVADHFDRTGGRPALVATSADLQKRYNLRAVQSGNWVLDDFNAGKFHMEQCAAAFADLADIAGISDSDVSMKGRLAMAFGARGHGGAKAHYEPVERVINITKMAGAGSLGHEWFHALDNLMMAAYGAESVEAFGSHAGPRNAKLPAALQSAFTALHDSMTKGSVTSKREMTITPADQAHAELNMRDATAAYSHGWRQTIARASSLDDALKQIDEMQANGRFGRGRRGEIQHGTVRRIAVAWWTRDQAQAEQSRNVVVSEGKPTSQYLSDAHRLNAMGTSFGKAGYWSEPHELAARAFAGYLNDKLAAGGRKNDYLTFKADNKYYKMIDAKPYPEGTEREAINRAFDGLFKALHAEQSFAKAAYFLAIPTVRLDPRGYLQVTKGVAANA